MTKELLKQALHQMERMLDLCDGLDGEEYDRAHQVMNAIRAHLANPLPDDWVMVPREPKNDMMNSSVPAWHTWKSRDNGGSLQALGVLVWGHMLAAAPTPKEQP